jgi:hypothetical protein
LKTQIITLESHDDLISVRDKFSWAKTPRILLVWPKFEKITLRLLDLKVLHRHADSLGSQLGLVTRRANVRRDAESLGIPVFKSTAAAQRDLWPDSPPRSRRIPKPPLRDLRRIRDSVHAKEASWRTSLLGRVLTFTVGVIAVLTVASIFVPRAALTLYPDAETQNIVIPVAASQSVQSVSVTGAVPAQTISVTLKAEQSLAITSEISVPKSKSNGIARFTNLSQVDIEIPAGTIVSTESSIRFVTLKDTRLPAGIKKFVDTPIEASVLGPQGNVLADKIVVVEGPLALSVSVTNPEVMTGGASVREIGATENDRAKLRNAVIENLRRTAESKMRAQIATADLLLLDTFEATKIMGENFEPPVGQPATILTLTMQVEYSARYVSDTELKTLSLSTLNSSVPESFEAKAQPTYKIITEPSTDTAGVSHFELAVSRTLLHQVDPLRVFSIVRGHRPRSIKDELVSSLALRADPTFIMTPSWWPWLPLIPFNIVLEIK